MQLVQVIWQNDCQISIDDRKIFSNGVLLDAWRSTNLWGRILFSRKRRARAQLTGNHATARGSTNPSHSYPTIGQPRKNLNFLNFSNNKPKNLLNDELTRTIWAFWQYHLFFTIALLSSFKSSFKLDKSELTRDLGLKVKDTHQNRKCQLLKILTLVAAIISSLGATSTASKLDSKSRNSVEFRPEKTSTVVKGGGGA